MRQFNYVIKKGRNIIDEGITNSLTEAKKAFKYGKNSYGNIIEILSDGSTTEIGNKLMGRALNCWE